MCHAIWECFCGCALKLVRFVVAAISFLFFLAAVGPYNATLSASPSTPGEFSYVATSVFLAGIGTASQSATANGIRAFSVGWYDLDTNSTCQNGTDVFELWAKPMGVCYPCSEGYCYATPAEVNIQQAMLTLAVILSGLLTIWRLVAICCTINCKVLLIHQIRLMLDTNQTNM